MTIGTMDYQGRGRWQSPMEFARELGVDDDAAAMEICRRARQFLSLHVDLSPGWIHSSLTFESLGIFPGDSLDDVAFVVDLQKCLDLELADNELEKIRSPEYTRGLTVGDFVRDVLRVTRDKLAMQLDITIPDVVRLSSRASSARRRWRG